MDSQIDDIFHYLSGKLRATVRQIWGEFDNPQIRIRAVSIEGTAQEERPITKLTDGLKYIITTISYEFGGNHSPVTGLHFQDPSINLSSLMFLHVSN